MGQKPDDWHAVSLCKECHATQHRIGERSFWRTIDPQTLIEAFCKASPKAAEIRKVREEKLADV